jgi:hypothetical protein
MTYESSAANPAGVNRPRGRGTGGGRGRRAAASNRQFWLRLRAESSDCAHARWNSVLRRRHPPVVLHAIALRFVN